MNLRGPIHFVHRWILHSREITATVPEFGLRLRVTPADVVGRHLFKYRRYEPEIAAALRANVRFCSGDVFLDVGANLGWYSLLVDRLAAGTCRTFAFEPDAGNFSLLGRNLALNDVRSATPVAMAVGERKATLALHRYGKSNAGRHSMLAIHEGETVAVPVTSLDEFWEERGLGDAPVRLIKMDIEGYEPIALRGARDVLARTEWALIEHSPAYMRKAGLDPVDLVRTMDEAGFEPSYPVGAKLARVSVDSLARSDEQRNVLWRRKR